MSYALDPTSDRPAFKQIADHLRAAIKSGDMAPGSKLPSEAELIERYGVAQGTVRRALDLLKGEGVVFSQQGRGVFVRERPPIRRQSGNRLRRSFRESGKGAAFDADAQAGGFTPSVEIYFVGAADAPESVAASLNLRKGSKVLTRSRRYLSNGHPVQLATDYVPWTLAKGTQMTEPNTGPGGLYARIEERGYLIDRFTEDVSARMPTPEEARALMLVPGVPVLLVHRVAYSGETPVAVCDTTMASDIYVLQYEVPGD